MDGCRRNPSGLKSCRLHRSRKPTKRGLVGWLRVASRQARSPPPMSGSTPGAPPTAPSGATRFGHSRSEVWTCEPRFSGFHGDSWSGRARDAGAQGGGPRTPGIRASRAPGNARRRAEGATGNVPGYVGSTVGDLNLRWVLGVVAIGIIVIAAGLALQKFSSEAWASVLIEGGVAVGLAGILVGLERRMVRRAVAGARDEARAVARQQADDATKELRRRVERLEDLDEAQALARTQRIAAIQQVITDLRTGEVRPSTVGPVLLDGLEGFFADRAFHVRTAAEPQCHVLYFLPLRDGSGMVPVMWLDFEPFTFSGQTLETGHGNAIQAPDRNPTTVAWSDSEQPSVVASELEEALERTNRPLHNFSFAFALGQLARSLEIMREARRAPAGDPRRIRGRLEFLVNDWWVITTEGLESINEDVLYPIQRAGFTTGRGVGIWQKGYAIIPSNDIDGKPGLAEAVQWLREREGVPVGDEPPPRRTSM